MKSVLISVLLCLGMARGISANPDRMHLETARMVFERVAQSEYAGIEFLTRTADLESTNVLIKGYRGAVMMMMAKYGFNPLAKWNYFIKGKLLLESAIHDQPQEIELIYLRLCIQTNAPRFLGYYSSIHSDIHYLRSKVESIADKNLQQRILTYLERPTIKNR